MPTPSDTQAPIRVSVELSVQQYLSALDEQAPDDLYRQVLQEVHVGLLRAVMRHVSGNQSQAALLLGMARNTLRKLLKEHALETTA